MSELLCTAKIFKENLKKTIGNPKILQVKKKKHTKSALILGLSAFDL